MKAGAAPALVAALLAAAAARQAPELSWENREYGIGVVVYPSLMTAGMKDVIRADASPRAAVVARLDGDTVCFVRPPRCTPSYPLMIEYAYEEPGWAILRYAPDSAWVEVSLGAAQRGAPTGWVRLRPDSVLALRWDTVLAQQALFFLHPDQAAFYRQPDERSRIDRALQRSPESGRYDHIMYGIERRGPWLRVALESPSFYCREPPARPRQDTLWIRYLTPALRPRVFFHTRGC